MCEFENIALTPVNDFSGTQTCIVSNPHDLKVNY